MKTETKTILFIGMSFLTGLNVKAQSTATLAIQEHTNGTATITWTGGTLQQTTNLLGNSWTTVAAATSPYTVSFTNKEQFYRVLVAPVPGDQNWAKWNFVCDDGSQNDFVLQRDGSPVAGSGNCNNCGPALPGVAGSCWANRVLINASGGNLYFAQSKDDQVYGCTYLYVNQPTSFYGTFNGDAFRIWLNDQYLGQGPDHGATFNLVAGWNKVEFTSYNQNQDTSVTIDIPLSQVLSMDSNGPNQ